MSNYIDDTAGSTITEGLDDYLIFGDVLNFSPMIGNLTNGQEYAYKAVFSDGATEGYENGVGTWNSSTNRLSRDTIKKSSNNDNKVSWPAGDKAIYIVADTELLTDMEQMVEGATKKILTASERSQIAANTLKNSYPSGDAAKVALITVTAPVNLDQLSLEVDALTGGMAYQGDWDASSGVFPGSGIAQTGWMWYVSTAGTVDSVSFDIGDNIVALKNNASTTTFALNWNKHDQTDAVQSVAGETGTVTTAELIAALGQDVIEENVAQKGRFPYKSDKDVPIFFINTGQSKALGEHVAANPVSISTRLKSFQITTPVTGPTLPSGTMIAPSDCSFQNVTMAQAATIYVPHLFTPYVGYRRGGYGCAGLVAASEICEQEQRDGYFLSICAESAPLSYWGAGSGGYVRIMLESYVTYILANTPALAGITAADIVFLDQGESNANQEALAYKDEWLTWYYAATWLDRSITDVYLSTFTDEYMAAPTISGGIPNWGGHSAVARYTNDKVQLVSGIGLEAEPGDTIHRSGDGDIECGKRLKKAVFGETPAKNIPNTEVELDPNPKFGGDPDYQGHTSSNVGTIAMSSNSDITNLRELQLVGALTRPPLVVSNADATLTVDDQLVIVSGTFSANHIIDLPATTGIIGRTYEIKNSAAMGQWTLTVRCAVGEGVIDNGLAQTFTLAAFESVVMSVQSINLWNIVSLSSRSQVQSRPRTLVTSSSFDLSANSNAELYDTIIFTGSGSVTLTFPKSSTRKYYRYDVINAKSSGAISFAYTSPDTAGTWSTNPLPSIGDAVTTVNDGTSSWVKAGNKRQGIYGGISVAGNVTAETSLTSSVPGGLLLAFNVNDVSNGCTPDNANNKITVPVAGVYAINFSWSGFSSNTAGANNWIGFFIYKNSSSAGYNDIRTMPANASNYFGSSVIGNVSCAAGDEITIRHLIGSTVTNFTCYAAQLTVRLIPDL